MDWLGAVTGIAGAIIVMKDIRLATGIWLFSNVVFTIWALYSKTYSIALLNGTYLIINSITIILRWRKP